ncbi:ABC transporter ATP-binding protein/permease [Leekyejoonella antrihumi]|uniref:ATP-binding cassette domain-containing protein n=1 Tax=Leekyejoonella antrihumi TaxID=1660198 RepID=A0A563E5S8_9MICO|nr:ABC transporter transmembrane domain-containing protein [Leekyejoonella antrihumi]TWP37918.1 ATP-binding cassette domain-containing protein [Leekyejoonella antrihumi]
MRPLEPRVLRLLPSCRRAVFVLGALGVVNGTLAIAQAFALSLLLVRAVQGHDITTAAMWTLGVLLARGICSAVIQLVADRAGADTAAQVRSLVIRRWLGQAADDRPDSARMLTGATSGATSVEPYVARYLPALVSAAVLPPVAILALLLTDWPSALIVLLTVPLLPLFAALIGKHTQEATQKRWHALTALAGHFLDVMRGLPTLAGYQRADAQVDVVDEVGQKHRRATLETLRIAFLSSAALELLATIAVAMVAVCVGLRLAYGTMSLQVALTAILLTPEAYWPIRRVGQEFHAAADGAAALQDLLPPERSQITPERSLPTPERSQMAPVDRRDDDPPCDIRDHATLTYRYPGSDHDVLHDLRVPLSRGLTALVGPSGCGKTTALELLAGLRAIPSTHERAELTAHLVRQRPFLAPLSVRDNVALGVRDLTDVPLRDAMQVTGLDQVVRGLGVRSDLSGAGSDLSGAGSDLSGAGSDLSGGLGLGVVLGDDGFGLSAGQRALVALTRAVLSGADLLLLDEPTAHLDNAVAEHLRALITDLGQDHPVIVATHDRALIERADHIVALEGAPA